MACIIVVGGQYGSEGKGKVVRLYAERSQSPYVVRCGGPNSGHTVTLADGRAFVFKQLPAAAEKPDALLLLAAGCAINEEILVSELDKLRVTQERVVVDPRAVLIEEEDRIREAELRRTIASTASGTGEATARRLLRHRVRLAGESAILQAKCRIESVAPLLHAGLSSGKTIIVEGTQGFGLSLLHGPDYPYLTSRDTTASGFASEAGLSPLHVSRVVMVLRTFPIRVGGNSGPFKDQTSWEQIAKISGAPSAEPEYTSVSRTVRRVAQFDLTSVRTACNYNRPTELAVMGLDRLDYRNRRAREYSQLSGKALAFLENLWAATQVPVSLVGTGFDTEDAIWIEDDRQEFAFPWSKTCANFARRPVN